MAVGLDLHCFYQRDLNWAQVSDVNFVWEKVSDGGSAYSKTYQGKTYTPARNINAAKAKGIPTGGYHYAQLSPSAEAQADVLVNECNRWQALQVAPMLDLEDPWKATTEAKNFAIAFCRRVLARGFPKVAVYMNSSMAKVLRPDQWGIAGLVIVIARYGAAPESSGPSQYTGHYDVHQFSSSGVVGGVTVDLDDSRNNNHLINNPEVPDMDSNQAAQLAALHNALVVPKTSKVPGSTAAFGTEEFVRFVNANTFDLVVNKIPAVLAKTERIDDLENQLSTLIQTVGRIEAKLNEA